LNKELKADFKSYYQIPAILPISQAKNKLTESQKKFDFYYSNTVNFPNPIDLSNNIFYIIANHEASFVREIIVAENSVSFSGETISYGELDKIKNEIKNSLKQIKNIRILNSKYKNIIQNSGVEFELEILF
jgi:hypothetical protein